MKLTAITADDSSIQNDINKNQLQQAGFVVVGMAKDGAEALKLIRELHPTIAALDYGMGPVNGAEVVVAVRAEGLPTKCFFITASGQKGAAYSHEVPVLIKPYNKPLLKMVLYQLGLTDALS